MLTFIFYHKDNKRIARFVCTVCKRKYVGKGHLYKHLFEKHSFSRLKKFIFSCSYCDRNYTSEVTYRLHFRRVHKDNVGLTSNSDCSNNKVCLTQKKTHLRAIR